MSVPVWYAMRLCSFMSACIAGRRHAFLSRMTNGKRPKLIVFCSGRIGSKFKKQVFQFTMNFFAALS